MKNKHLVLIGDVIQSRKKFNPGQWQHFHNAISTLNQDMQEALHVPLVIYSGDSFGGIAKDPSSALKLLLLIQEQLKPIKARMVLVEDEVSFGLENRNFLELEGPALWKSSEKMQELKDTGGYFMAELQNNALSLSVNAALNLIIAIKYDWDELEWSIYQQYPHQKNQQEIAQQRGVSQQYISKLIRQSKFHLVKNAEKDLIQLTHGASANA